MYGQCRLWSADLTSLETNTLDKKIRRTPVPHASVGTCLKRTPKATTCTFQTTIPSSPTTTVETQQGQSASSATNKSQVYRIGAKGPRVHAGCNSVVHSAQPRVLHSAGGAYIKFIQNKLARFLLVQSYIDRGFVFLTPLSVSFVPAQPV